MPNQYSTKTRLTLEDFDLTSSGARAVARQRGLLVPKRRPGPKPKEFWSLVVKTESCWLWQGSLNRDGYGLYNVNYRKEIAHRWAWLLLGGDSINGKILRHVVCDTPACVRPSHCAPGTHQDNQRDKVLKNRQAKGESVGGAVLTEADVLKMRQLKADGLRYRDIAPMFNVCYDTTQKAIRGINWRHI